jgi:hypothetical protein
MTFFGLSGVPWADQLTASSAVNTTWPLAAPGDAGNPFVATGIDFQIFSSNIGARS